MVWHSTNNLRVGACDPAHGGLTVPGVFAARFFFFFILFGQMLGWESLYLNDVSPMVGVTERLPNSRATPPPILPEGTTRGHERVDAPSIQDTPLINGIRAPSERDFRQANLALWLYVSRNCCCCTAACLNLSGVGERACTAF